MARQLLELSCYPGRDFEKGFKKLSASQQGKVSSLLENLYDDLLKAKSLFFDSNMKKWRPTAYHVLTKDGVQLVELRCNHTTRVIVRHVADTDNIILVAITITHDHVRLKRQIEAARTEIVSSR